MIETAVDLGTDKQNTDAEIQPEHQKQNCGQTSVHIGKIAEIGKIQRKSVGKQDPADSREYGARNLPGQPELFTRHYRVETRKASEKQRNGQQAAQTDDVLQQRGQKREKTQNQVLDGAAEYEEHQGHRAGSHEHQGVKRTNQTPGQITALLFGAPDPVQSLFDAHHAPCGRPQRHQTGDGEDGSRRLDIEIVHDPNDQSIQHIRHHGDQKGQEIRFPYGRDKLNQCEQQHDKREKREDNKKGCIRRIYGDLIRG